MDDRIYRTLLSSAIMLTVAWVGWSIYTSVILEETPGDNSYLAGNSYFEDGRYEEALREYNKALTINPQHLHAKRGKARSLMQLGHHYEALMTFNEVIALEPDFAASYANRGILHDRLGIYAAAVEDYEKALQLDPELAEGPHWMTRFLRNQANRPPSIADRARYIRSQMEKPESERVLRIPQADRSQRPFKL
jgi:tetratricopeptide (TPR) repeat protein